MDMLWARVTAQPWRTLHSRHLNRPRYPCSPLAQQLCYEDAEADTK
ncbi:MAG: hypothetical protein ABSB25_11465 [Sedimentisphaerales bacterium]